MSAIVLGVDQGTSSTRCLAFDEGLNELSSATVEVAVSHPAAGLVEQDPERLLGSVSEAMRGALAAAGVGADAVTAVGIANQTETFVVCDRATGAAIHPAIVWQDRRTADRCQALAAAGHESLIAGRTGLELDATFPATKIGWVLDRVPGARARAQRGELVYHDVAGWLVRRLCGGELCDASNAGRTLLCALGGDSWDGQLLELFGVPAAMLPPIVDCDRVADLAGAAGPPITASLGDQQASLFGLGCLAPGTAKVTLGTGAFVLVQAGAIPPDPPAGVLASCAWRRAGATSFALEGFIPAAGAALDWFAAIGVLPPARELDALLTEAGPEDDGIACVPALQGLGTPSWDAATSGTVLGLTRATTRARLARAIVDGVVHQIADALEAIAGAVTLDEVLLDGGVSRSDWVLQRLADLSGITMRRAAHAEATARGAAALAGLAAGVWADVAELPPVAVDRVAEPAIGADERARRRGAWERAVSVASQWTPDDRGAVG
jgi:glycerol kinase